MVRFLAGQATRPQLSQIDRGRNPDWNREETPGGPPSFSLRVADLIHGDKSRRIQLSFRLWDYGTNL
jgi:hypothetical protein